MSNLHLLKYTLLVVLLIFASVGCTTTSTTTKKEPRRPSVRVDLAGNQIKEKLFFAGFVATGFDQKAAPEKLKSWGDNNLLYGQYIINLPGKESNQSKNKLQNFNKLAFENFSHPEFDVSLGLSGEKPKAFVFAIDEERITTEKIGDSETLVADITGQIIVFDWKDRVVLASYPLIFSAKDIYDPKLIKQKMNQLYYEGWGENSIGFLDYFVKYLKEKVSLTFYYDGQTVNKAGVENIVIEAKALPFLMKENITVGDYKQKLAQRFMAYLAKNQNLAIVPYGFPDDNGQRKLSIVPGGGAMAGLFEDNSANELIIPKADYAFDIYLESLKEVEVERGNIDKVMAYASFLKVTVTDSARTTVFFEDEFKKILTRHLPIDFNPKPWRWLDYSTIILIDDITRNINNPDSKWCKAQSNGTKTKRAMQNLYDGQLSTCLSPLPNY